jgi:hypothetical protein
MTNRSGTECDLEEENQQDLIASLPDHILSDICRRLSARSLQSLYSCCSYTRATASAHIKALTLSIPATPDEANVLGRCKFGDGAKDVLITLRPSSTHEVSAVVQVWHMHGDKFTRGASHASTCLNMHLHAPPCSHASPLRDACTIPPSQARHDQQEQCLVAFLQGATQQADSIMSQAAQLNTEVGSGCRCGIVDLSGAAAHAPMTNAAVIVAPIRLLPSNSTHLQGWDQSPNISACFDTHTLH